MGEKAAGLVAAGVCPVYSVVTNDEKAAERAGSETGEIDPKSEEKAARVTFIK
jgi:hypothetical protein